MLTLKEWYDKLTPVAQKWVKNHCNEWFDESTPDYYKADLMEEVSGNIVSETSHPFMYDEIRGSGCNISEGIINRYCKILQLINKTHPEIISDKDYDTLVMPGICRSDIGYLDDLWRYGRTLEQKKQLFLQKELQQSSSLYLKDYLFTVSDYSKLDINLIKKDTLDQGIIDIIGYDNAKAWAIDHPKRLVDGLSDCEESELFDELFFGDSDEDNIKGWSSAVKSRVLYDRYHNMTNLSRFNDFLYRMVAVDHHYLRHLGDYLANYPALGNMIATAKKPESELDGTESVANRFRYSPEIRKLGKIANACIRKTISKTNHGSLHEHGSLVKLYNYSYKDIYDAMYPDEIVL